MSIHTRQPTRPLIAVVGATGTGKSDLAVEIATRFDGEIINGDAMQLYDGLPIITNKIPASDRKGIPHHLLGCIGLNEPTWTVGNFVKSAIRDIEGIRSRGKIPILVGGTHYYTQALLFNGALMDEEDEPPDDEHVAADLSILDEPTDVILAKLREVDPVMANRWHPNDRRKIQRSLEIFLRSGKPASKTYEDQSLDGQPSLRYETLIFWTHASKDALFPRLDARVLKMVQGGLLEEFRILDDLRQKMELAPSTVDLTRGIWVSIGYKEFMEYQNALNTAELPEAELLKMKANAIERTQAATRQYSNRQIRWIRIKLLSALARANAVKNLFLLDGSDLSRWSHEVVEPTNDVVAKFLRSEQLPDPTTLSETAAEYLVPKQNDVSVDRSMWVRQTCTICGVTAVTAADWEKHTKSHGHRKALSAKAKRESNLQRAKSASSVG